MLLLKKIDCYVQWALATVMLLFCFIPFGNSVFMAGFFILGWWQVFSATLNTYSFVQCGFTQRIFRYWIFCLSDLVLFFFAIWLDISVSHGLAEILILTSLIGALVTAVYYWWIYYRLMGFIFLRNELEGLTKSKH